MHTACVNGKVRKNQRSKKKKRNVEANVCGNVVCWRDRDCGREMMAYCCLVVLVDIFTNKKVLNCFAVK
jgi:hypothetical protein